jgi:predicted permease
MAAVVAPVVESDPRLKGSAPYLESVREVIHPVGRPIMRFLLAAAGLVLLVGCANLANMMLARGRRQERETAVRSALGASRLRVIRPLLAEALILGVAAASLALIVTRLSFDVLLRQVPRAAYGSTDIGLDLRVILMTIALGVVGGLIFAVVPAWRSARLDVLALIQGRHRAASHGARLGRPMIAVQVAVALVLAFGAAVAAKAFVAILQVPLGFSAENVVRIQVQPPAGTQDIAGFYRTLTDGLRGHPDVIAVGASGTPPLSGISPWSSIRRPGSNERIAGVVHVSAGYFEAIGLDASNGRLLEPADASAAQAAVVSSSAARALFGGTEPVGQFIPREDGPAWQVVGVVPDFRGTFGDQTVPHVYVIPGGRTSFQSVYARVRARSDGALTRLRRETGRLAPGAPVLADWWADGISDLTTYKNPRFQTMVLTAFAGIALSLTALGVFGVVAFLVAARSREMGIRIAIGASPASLVGLMARQTLIPVGLGLGLGLAATRWAARLAETQLFAVETRDPWLLALTSAIVLAAALLAAYLPARRAARVDPLVVLRAE